MTKIFISYSSKDRPLIQELAADLDLLLDNVTIWYDRELNRTGGHPWWNSILHEIRGCDLFIYALSPNVLKSEPCRREYGYARALNKPILPLIMVDLEIRYLPVELQAAQLTNFRERSREQQRSLKASIRNLPPAPALPAPMPIPPDAPLDPVGVLLDRIARLSSDADQQRLLIVHIEDLSEEDAFAMHVPELLERLIERDDILTVRNLKRAQELLTRVSSSLSPTIAEISRINTPPSAPTRPRAIDLLPAPFAWIDIPGKIGKKWTGSPYAIAKYPVTNAQFRPFIEAGGYRERQWWTELGWEVKAKGWNWDGKAWAETNKAWTEPRYWTDKQWNGAEQPVVGISWYEAVAYCLWLSDTTGEKIMLPTEDQWQYAAQGDDGREYPWGSEWDCAKCNNSVQPCDSNVTTPVRDYEGKGDSFFGVTDMAGNVWEWCSTNYEDKTNDINMNAQYRVLRGGSWVNYYSDFFRASNRGRYYPHYWFNDWGFRLALS